MPRSATASCAALVLALSLAGCGSDEPAVATPTTAPTPSATSAGPTPSAGPSTPEPVVTPDDAQLVTLTVAGGEVTGDIGRVEVPQGATVRLSVTSDVADEIHVHGFDLYEDVSPGQTSQLEFVADRPGIFEVELHDARQVLTRLQIA